MHIREFRIGDEMALHAVFHSAIHEIASQNYTLEQVNAWAPQAFDRGTWIARMRAIRPFVVETEGKIVAYADIQPTGYINHFFVSGSHARAGIGTMLMNRIHEAARMQGIKVLTSDVSRTAQRFFERFRFVVVENRAPVIRGVVIPNALMRRELLANASVKGTSPGLPRHVPRAKH